MKKLLVLCAALLLIALLAAAAFAGEEPHRHEAGEPVTQEVAESGCDTQKEYREVITCKICGQLLSSKLIIGKDTKHEPAEPVKENIIRPTCAATGQYESVICCKICGLEMQRIWKEVPESDYHISEYSLKRTLTRGENNQTIVTFSAASIPPLKKNGTLQESFNGVTVEAGFYLIGDGSQRTCADGEERCALCGKLLNPQISHHWEKTDLPDAGIVCSVCGVDFFSTPGISRVLVTLMNKFSGKYELYDTDGDDKITPADARYVLRYSVGLGDVDKVITPELFKYADADRDGEITPADARLYLRAAVGLRTA